MEPESYPSLVTRRRFVRQAACAALGAGALKNIIHDLRLMNAVMAQTYTSDYKALVCIFLSGGNDGNNMIIPTIASEYGNYAAIRTPVLAIPQASILPISPINSDGHTYGFHPSFSHMQTLFGEAKAATVFNVGNLAYPITRAQYTANPRVVGIPLQLFSHSDQVTQWQTSIADRASTNGWGGRIADLLDSSYNGAAGQVSLTVSTAGANTFEIGNVVTQYSVSTAGAVNPTLPTSGTSTSPDYFGSGTTSPRKSALLGLTAAASATNQPDLQVREYAKVLNESISLSTALNSAIAPYTDPTDASYTNQSNAAPWRWNNELAGIYKTTVQPSGLGGFPNTTLGLQLKMIARLIAGRAALGMRRQIFFCSVGGYDTHTNQTDFGATNPALGVNTGSQASLLAEVDQCVLAFQRAMEQLKGGSNWTGEAATSGVTVFTASDFGRTLPSNGQGSDHGWGSHHLVIGDAVDGKKTFGKFPTLAVNGPDDTSTGRWIPTMAVDQYAAALATWFGVSAGNLATVFPNLPRFATPPSLFKPGT